MSHFYPQPGTVLADRYRVGAMIGRGGMGVVLEAQNVVTQRRVAIKWLSGDLADNQEAAERLIREASAASQVSHPNVVDVYDVLRDKTSIFLVMELLKGEPLSALIRRGGMPLHQLIGLIIPAMHGVAEAHRQNIIHRDIHPGNIFLAEEGHDRRIVPKVLDFGISKVATASGQHQLTRSNICMGTPLYMSYEQLCSARDVDHRTDVYSFGVVLYEAITGRRPYDGDSLVEVAGKITAGNPIHPKQLRPDIPTALAELVLWAMARKKDDRIDSVESLIAELEPFASPRAFRSQMTDQSAALPAAGRGSQAGEPSPVAEAAEVDEPDPALRTSSRRSFADRKHGSGGRASAPSERPIEPLPMSQPSAVAHGQKVDTLGHVNSPLAQSIHPRSAKPLKGSLLATGALLLAGLLFGGGFWYASTRTAPPSVADHTEAASSSAPAPAAVAPPDPDPASTKPVVVQPPTNPSVPSEPSGGAIGTQDAGLRGRTGQGNAANRAGGWKRPAQGGGSSVGTDKPSPKGPEGFRAGTMRPEDMLPAE